MKGKRVAGHPQLDRNNFLKHSSVKTIPLIIGSGWDESYCARLADAVFHAALLKASFRLYFVDNAYTHSVINRLQGRSLRVTLGICVSCCNELGGQFSGRALQSLCV